MQTGTCTICFSEVKVLVKSFIFEWEDGEITEIKSFTVSCGIVEEVLEMTANEMFNFNTFLGNVNFSAKFDMNFDALEVLVELYRKEAKFDLSKYYNTC